MSRQSTYAQSPGASDEHLFRAGRPLLEALEPRLLLSAAWEQGGPDEPGGSETAAGLLAALPDTLTSAEGFAYFHNDGISHDTQGARLSGSEKPRGDAYIGVPGDVDSFYFSGDTLWSGTYTIRAEAPADSDVVPIVAVYDPNDEDNPGKKLKSDENPDGDNIALLEVFLSPTKRYIVAVADSSGLETGDVELIIEAPASTVPTTIPIGADGDGSYSLEYLGVTDSDYFCFTSPANASGALTITVDPLTSPDTIPALFDAAGNELFEWGYLDVQVDRIVARQLAPSTEYYLTVLAKDYAGEGPFEVFVDFQTLETIRGTKYNDLNDSGSREGNEPPLPGCEVFLDMNNNGVLDTYQVTLADLEGQWPRVSVPDGGMKWRAIDFFLPGGAVVDVNVRLKASAGDASKLLVTLARPELSTYCKLVAEGDATGTKLTETTFDDEAAAPLLPGGEPYTGRYLPNQPLSVFDGQQARGEWRLTVHDVLPPDGLGATLYDWQLELTVEEPTAVTNIHGEYVFEDMPAGAYVVGEVPRPGWKQTGGGEGGFYYGGNDRGDRAVMDASGSVFLASCEMEYSGYFPRLNGMAYDTKDHVLYALEDDPGGVQLLRVDPITLAVTSIGPVPGLPAGSAKALAYNPLDDRLYCGLIAIDPETLTTTGSNPSHPYRLEGGAYNPIDHRLYLYYYRLSPENAEIHSYQAFAPFSGPLIHVQPLQKPFYGITHNRLHLVGGLRGTSSTDLATYSPAFGDVTPMGIDVDVLLDSLAYAPTPPGMHAVVLEEGSPITGLDFTNHELDRSLLRGAKWNDLDGDGWWDTVLEPPLSGWEIFLDSNNNGVRDEAALTRTSTDVGKPINDLSWTVSKLAVSGAPTEIQDLNVGLTIEHTYDADLSVYLISPSGTVVELFSGVGGEYDDFLETRLDADAGQSITTGAAPFTGVYRPEGDLRDLDGEDPNGTWALAIYDGVFGDEGRLVEWSLTMEASEPRQLTDGNGEYIFADLVPGTYVVCEQLNSGWVQTHPAYRADTVPYEFEDISETGAAVLAGADDEVAHLGAGDLDGFTFNLYGTTYSDVYFSSNGLITFGGGYAGPNNTGMLILPNQAAIAPFWDDLVIPPRGVLGPVYWEVRPDGRDQRLILQWNRVEFNAGPYESADLGPITFQAVLWKNSGAIQFNYRDLDSHLPGALGALATVGIKGAGAGADRMLLCHDNGPTLFVDTGVSTRIAPVGLRHHVMTLGEGQTVAQLDFGNLQSQQQSPAPAAPDLLPGSDTGFNNDDLTLLNNSSLQKTLEFSVGGTVSGATVTIHADGNPIGSALATGTTTTVTTNGIDALADGAHSITARQAEPGKLESGDSAALTVTIDTQPPRVLDTLVAGTQWQPSFLEFLEDQGLGSGGYSIPVGSPDQLDPLPWVNLDQVKIVFTEDVDLVGYHQVGLYGVDVPQYAFAGLVYDPGARTGVLYLTSEVEADKLLLVVHDTVRDIAGNALDGEWTDGVSTYPSGNGSAGGDFRFRFNALPGDVDGSGEVRASDTIKVRRKSNTDVGDAEYSVFYDVDGSGEIRSSDTIKVRRKSNTELPPGEPVVPPASPSGASADAALIAAALRAAEREADSDALAPILPDVLSLAEVLPLGV